MTTYGQRPLGHQRQHRRVGQAAGHVVDHRRPGVQGRGGDAARMVSTETTAPASTMPGDHRSTRAALLVLGRPGGAGTGGLAAHVQQVGALVEQPATAGRTAAAGRGGGPPSLK
jgi:hypothetical protein